VSPDQDDYLDDDAESRKGTRGVLAAGWLRALLLLSALAVVLVFTVPYLLERLAPAPPDRTSARPAMTEPAKPEPAVAPALTVTPPPAPTPAPATKSEPVPPSEPAAPSPAAPASASDSKEAAPAKLAPKPPHVAARETAPSATPKPAGAAKRAATPTTGTGDYWVQVGLFANGDNAERLAKELRAERFSVEVAQTTRGGGTAPVNHHEVVVSGASVDTVAAALKGTGTAEAVGGVVVIRPSMDLKDAVTLSRRLAGEGLEVRIRRVSAPLAGGGTVYLVRVGGYATRDAAAAGKRELAAKGVGGFVIQGPTK
jgi:cell division septation protein DedD